MTSSERKEVLRNLRMAILLSSTTVHFVLDHICPLSAQLPPHIISTPLRQRHHFLAILPENPVDYLAWPSPNQSHAVNRLQSLPLPSHDLLFPVQYSADPENIFAHARITSDIRLIFLWNIIQGWQYHNVALMPFPANSYPSLTDAIALYSPDDFLPEQQHPTANVTDNDDLSYWDSYGRRQVSDHIARTGMNPESSSEDAYWAQYSTVQGPHSASNCSFLHLIKVYVGSGDSTLPSPPHRKKASETGVNNPMPERIIVPSDDLQIHRVEPYNPLEPLSPDALARRLAVLSSSNGANSPPFLDDSPTTDSETPSPNIGSVNHTQGFSSQSITHQQPDEHITTHPQCDSDDRAQNALRDSIRSLYQFWKLSRPDRHLDQDKALFLSTVHRVIDQL